MKRICASLIAFGVVAGCVADEVGDEPTSSVEQGLKCPNFGCGENSPLLGPLNIRQLNKTGVPNSDDVRLTGFVKGGVTYTLDVVKDRLRAWRITFVNGLLLTVTLEHQQLVGGSLRLEYPTVPDFPPGPMYVRIDSVDQFGQEFWVGPDDPVETYEFTYSRPDLVFGAPEPICKNPLPVRPGLPPSTKRVIDGDGHVWPNKFSAVVFAGDLYNTNYTVTIPTGADAVNWFNIACAGSAPAKLHLNRHTTAGAYPGFTTTQAQRQAMFKMYGGDFCGDGLHFTQQGTPINWRTSTNLASPSGSETTVESLWDDQGAVCMTTHRLQDTPPYYDLYAIAIRNRCDMPLCPATPNVATSGQYILTKSPATSGPTPYPPAP